VEENHPCLLQKRRIFPSCCVGSENKPTPAQTRRSSFDDFHRTSALSVPGNQPVRTCATLRKPTREDRNTTRPALVPGNHFLRTTPAAFPSSAGTLVPGDQVLPTIAASFRSSATSVPPGSCMLVPGDRVRRRTPNCRPTPSKVVQSPPEVLRGGDGIRRRALEKPFP
jgi:hypothetical protein